ncbi:MAG: hypothetical protein V4664_00785 [Patescibacteria group bacterium]
MLRNHNHRTRDYLRSDRVIKRKRRRFTRILLVILFFLILIIGGIIFVVRLDAFAVKTLKVEGNHDVSADELITLANEYATSSWLYFFPRRNIAFYPTGSIEAELRARYPRFSDVAVYRTSINSVQIEVIERHPRALWCDSSEQCYTVDDQGFIYAPYVSASSTTADLIRFSGGAQDATNPIGTNINSSSTFSDITLLLQGMKERGLTPEHVVIRNNHEFSVKVNPGGDVIFSDIRPLNESLSNLSAALQSAAFKATSSPQTFEYIDTRFGNKIFFKLQK